ncbi:hypothetical protein DLJ47_30985 [Micromonospora sp. S4605]|uniref:hypothetical protein n=1 Tax=Micromonospora sp. S4605 TaxID=1420897 RepID=UPI000D6F6C4F|nr:hypothetical protein [Micromonospora sp. S4605]PWU47218.1 hypothetical protein DLJ47_30985 [Micromonospora sp. S4605]
MNSDQVQATASVAATVLTGAVLWWEVHSRNRERRDAERGQARLILCVLKHRYDSEAGDARRLVAVDVVVANVSEGPILNVLVHLSPLHNAFNPLVERWGHVLRAGDETGFRYTLPEPLPWGEIGPDSFARLAMSFTDASGLEWYKEDDGTLHRFVVGDGVWNKFVELSTSVRRPLWGKRARSRAMGGRKRSSATSADFAGDNRNAEMLANTER